METYERLKSREIKRGKKDKGISAKAKIKQQQQQQQQQQTKKPKGKKQGLEEDVVPDVHNASKKRRWKYGDDAESDDAEEEHHRAAFTPGWNQNMTSVEGLPVKIGGKVIKTYVERAPKTDRDEHGDEDEDEKSVSDNESDSGDDSQEESESHKQRPDERQEALGGPRSGTCLCLSLTI